MKKKLFFILLLLLNFINLVTAQNVNVKGTVIDKTSGSPMPYVNVMVKGTTIGTITGNNGTFNLSSSNTGILVFSFIGYKTVEIPFKNGEIINIEMDTDALNLDEVVMVAYGAVKKTSLTGSVSSVGASSIEKRPVTNALAALSGTTPGLQVNTSYGQPGYDPELRIRGFGSVNFSSEPLIVLDGSPYNGVIANINPADIESINILKDAASTALYGSRGSNGVVMITTKRGRKENLNVYASFGQGFSNRGLSEYERVNAFEYYPLMWESLRNGLITPTRPKDQASILASGGTSNGIVSVLGYNPFKGITNDQVVGTDGILNVNATKLLWQDDLNWTSPIQTIGLRTDALISANGGNNNTDYYLSVGYTSDNGWIKKMDYKRYSARANVNFNPTKWLSFGANINASLNKSYTPNTDSNSGFANIIGFARSMGPIYPVYQHNRLTGEYILDDDGNRLWDFGPSVVLDGVTYGSRPQAGGRHATAEHLLNRRDFERNTIQSRTYIEFTFLKDFKLKLSNSFDINNYIYSSYENPLVGDGAPQGRSSKESTLRYTITNIQMLTYNKTFGKHEVNLMAAHENYKNDYKYFYGFRQGEIIPDNPELINFTTTNSLYSYFSNHNVEGYLARGLYSFDNGRYTLEGSFRRDGSSKFENSARWGSFWSLGAGWRIDREPFMTTLK